MVPRRQNPSMRSSKETCSLVFVTVLLLNIWTEVSAFVPAATRFAAAPTLPAVIDRQQHRHETDSMLKLGMSSAALEPPARGNSQGRSFEDRMRDMVLGGRKRRRHENRKQSKLPPNVKICRTLDDYKKVVGEERERLVATRFFAPWCKACKTVAAKFHRLAREYPDVVFVEVPVTQHNVDLHRGLGVTTLPFGHIYHPQAGLVEEVRLAGKFFPAFADKLRSYVEGESPLGRDGSTESPYVILDDGAHPQETSTAMA